jgi:Zn-dependent protease with chaperone function/Tfp pilus assembly protein PilF
MVFLLALVIAQATVAPKAPEPLPYPAELEKVSEAAYQQLTAGQPAPAETALRQIIAQAPDNPRSYRLLGFALLNQGRFKDAIDALDQAEARHLNRERLPSMLVARAQARAQLKQMAAARADLKRALEIEPDDGNSLVISASLWLNQQDLLSARRDLEHAVRAHPEHVGAHLFLARVLGFQDEHEASRAQIGLAQKLHASAAALADADEYNRRAERRALLWKLPLELVLIMGLGVLGLFLAGGALSLVEMRSLRDLRADALQSEATATERVTHWLYSAVLWCGTVFFYLSVPAMVVVSLAVGLGLIYLMFTQLQSIPIKLVILLVIVAGGGAWAVLRSLFVRLTGRTDGLLLTEADEPRLFGALREVSEVAGTRMVDEVYLELDAAAAVRESGGAVPVLLGRGKRVLHLGLWTLFALDVSQLKAVLAHEYGHFSHGETRLTPIIARMQATLFGMLSRIAGLGRITLINPVYWYLRGYFHAFLAATAGHSRRMELLADRSAALAYGGDTFGAALGRVVEADLVFDRYAGRFAGLLRQMGRPCSELYRAVMAAWAVEPASIGEARRKAALSRKPGKYDSHPAAADRIARVAGVLGRSSHDAVPAAALLTDVEATARRLAERIRANVDAQIAQQKTEPQPAVEMAPEAQIWFAEGLALHSASVERQQAKDPESRALLVKAIDRLRAALGDKNPTLVPLLLQLAQEHEKEGNSDAARAALREGLEILTVHPNEEAQRALQTFLARLEKAA